MNSSRGTSLSTYFVRPIIWLVLLLLICGAFLSNLNFRTAKATSGWLSGYDYRVKIPVNATASGAQSDYQMAINLHSGSGTNVVGDIYFNGHLQDSTTFNDIRFTASDGTTLKNFWIQSVSDETGGRKAIVYVKLDTPAANSTNYYVYYGKAGATNASSYDNTFTKDFSDSNLLGLWHMDESTPGTEKTTNGDFENWTGSNLDNWTFDSTSAGVRDITKESSIIHSGSYAVKLTATNAGGTAFGLYQNITTTSNANYQVTVYQEYASRTAGTLKFEAYDNTHSTSLANQTITTTSAAYSLVSYRFTSTNTTDVRIKIYLNSETTSGVAYVDNISVKQSGNTLTDSSPSAMADATINGAARTSTDGGQWDSVNQQFATGSALQFDGKNDYVSLGNGALDVSGTFSIEVWIHPDMSAVNGGIVTKHSNSANPGDGFALQQISSNKVSLNLYQADRTSRNSSKEINIGQWNHIVAVYDGSYIYVYVNGVSSVPMAVTGFSPAHAQNLTLGKFSYTSSIFYYGLMDDVRLYDRVLSQDEVSRHYIRSKYAAIAPTWASPGAEELYAFTVVTMAITTASVTNVSATLSGYLSGMAQENTVDVAFKYGTNSGSLDQTSSSQTMTERNSYTINVPGLSPNTTYYYQAIATGSTQVTGSVLSFKTAFIGSDYYYGFSNSDGSTTFTNKNTGATILDSAPKYYLNYGDTTSTAMTVANHSFEETTVGQKPAGWTFTPASPVNTTFAASNDHASDGVNSLKFGMTGDETSNRYGYSPLMTLTQDHQYTIQIDSYLSHTYQTLLGIYILYYSTIDGTGSSTQDSSFVSVHNAASSWYTNTINWKPQTSAKSFKIWIIAGSGESINAYFDNIRVTDISKNYISNGSGITSTVTTSGDSMTVTSVDTSASQVNVTHKYEVGLHTPTVKYTSTLTYKQDVDVYEERFDFIAPTQSSSVMKRDLTLTTFDPTALYYTDPLTAKVVKFDNGLSFLGQDNFQTMRLQTSGAVNSQLSFYADRDINHPHSYYDVYPIPGGDTPAQHVVDISANHRETGDSYDSYVEFKIDPGVTPKTLVKTRQPYGYDAVLVFTNHPDAETLARINAVGYGTEDTSSPDYGTKGILGRGLAWTRSVYVSGQSGADLADSNFKALADKMYADGAEIIGHTITPNVDSRSVVSSGMSTLSQYGARNWIDHGASANPEALSGRGIVVGDPYYDLDLFDQNNYQYAWSYLDYDSTNYDLNLLSSNVTANNRPIIFYNNNVDANAGDSKKIYLWADINTDKTPDLYYTQTNVDNLISQKGVHIAHEYMGNASSNNHSYYTNPVTGKVEITPTFDNELAYIASKKEAGLLWSTTISNLDDYLVGIENIKVTNNDNGTYTVTNNNSSALTGVTLLAESAIQSVDMDGTLLTSFGGSYGNNELILPTISAGQSVTLSLTYGAKSSSTPTVVSNNTGKNKVNEIASYWNTNSRHLTMQAEGRSGTYSFTATIPQLANNIVIIRDTSTGSTVGSYLADAQGNITFSAALGSVHTFDIGQDTPTLNAQSASSITTNSAILNGEIVATGGPNATTRGFKYYQSSDCSGGENEISENGSFAAAGYSLTLSNLSPSTNYSYRAYAVNAAGLSTSMSCQAFTTESVIPTYRTIQRYLRSINASFSAPDSGPVNTQILFDASESYSSRGISKYVWDFGDGLTGEGEKIKHQYETPGRYTVILTITDKSNRTAKSDKSIDIVPPAPIIDKVEVSGDDVVISGKAYAKTKVNLTIQSNPITATSDVDEKGNWSYKLINAKEVLGSGSHMVSATDVYSLPDSTELKSAKSNDYQFSLAIENGKLVIANGEKNKTWPYILFGLIAVLIIGGAIYIKKRKK